MKTQLLIILVIVFYSCKSEKKEAAIDWRIPIVKDSLTTTNKYFKTKSIKKPFNQLLFIGPKQDSIRVTKNSLNQSSYYSEFTEVIDSVKRKSEIEIVVDFSQDLSIDLETFSFPPAPIELKGKEYEIDKCKTDSIFEIWKKRPRNYVKAYPVFIKNITQDTVRIDNQDGKLFIIQEAKNKLGEWKPIEYWKYSKCGNSYGYTSLGSNDILILKKVKYQGGFKTEMRLKLRTNSRNIYSKPFKGSLNIEQFDIENINGFIKNPKKKDKEWLDYMFLNK